MDELIYRINTIIKERNLTAARFADEIGVQRSSISHLLSGRNKPSLDFIIKTLNRFPDIDTNWLLFGKVMETKAAPTPSFVPKQMQLEENPIRDIPEKKEQAAPKKPSAPPDYSSELKTSTNSDVEKIVVFNKDNTFEMYNPR